MSITFTEIIEYLGVQELKDALRDINELQTGTRQELAKRVYNRWLIHNRKVEDLLDFLDKETFATICYDFNLNDKGDKETLKRRIKKELEGSAIKKIKVQEEVASKKESQSGRKKYLMIGIVSAIIIITTIGANLVTISDWVEKRFYDKESLQNMSSISLDVSFIREPDSTTFTVIGLSNNGTIAGTNLRVTVNPSHDIIGLPHKEYWPDDFKLDKTGDRAFIAEIPRLSSCSKVMMSVNTNSILENERFIIHITSDQGNTLKFDSDTDGKKIVDINSKFNMSLPC